MTNAKFDRELEAAQAAVIAHFAPETTVRRVRWSQGETQVLELGSGSPLLLIHGGLSSVIEWVPILPALARHHRVLVIDRPGHGLADPFDYRGVDMLEHACTFLGDILDALDLRAVAVAGNSIGGLWAAAFALEHPERVTHLALVGAPAGHKRGGPAQFRLLALPLVGQRLARFMFSSLTRESNRKTWADLLVARPENVPDVLLDADVAHTRRNLDSMVSLLGCLLGPRGVRRQLILGKRWLALSMPTIFLWGEHDAFGTPEEGQALVAANTNVRVVRIPRAGHLPWIDEPERTVSELERFLENGALVGR